MTDRPMARPKRRTPILLRYTRSGLWLAMTALVAGVAGLGVIAYAVSELSKDLPDHRHLANYVPPTVTRIHAGDGRLLAEYAREKRVFVPIDAIPPRVKNAFIAAEDQRFYSHIGLDPVGIARAAIAFVENYGTGQRPQGASTITQQVAKNFFLTNEVSFDRKIREALLALRMEDTFSKDQILELYLNEIFLGYRSYGVAAAALNYFDKALEDLTIAEAAYLAGLPKAPSRYDPVRKPAEALARRDYVIGRMLADGHIDEPTAQIAYAEPLKVHQRQPADYARADFFTEEVRRELVARFGEEGFYGGGLSVRTTVDPRLQGFAERALRDGLVEFDRRKGFAGPYTTIDLTTTDWQDFLAQFDPGFELADWQAGVVLRSAGDGAEVGLVDGSTITLRTRHLSWARARLADDELGPPINSAQDVVKPGDVITVAYLPPDDGEAEGIWALRQRPEVEGAIVAMDPHTGRVLALTGGFSFRQSKFNRATQAYRQPGSAFKPFVYLAAFEAGRTPSTIVLDAPLVVDQGPGLPKWKPANYSDQFYGPSTLRLGVEKSRNLMTVRLAQDIGMARVVDVAERFAIDRNLGNNLAASLGANEIDLLSLTTAYAMLVNGGHKIEPALVERIQDRYGETVMRRDQRLCLGCAHFAGYRAIGDDGQAPAVASAWPAVTPDPWAEPEPPEIPDSRAMVADPRNVYQIVHVLEGVVRRGTAVRAAAIGKPLAGKTGTTNDSRDAWFVGFSPDLVAGVYVGYDTPRSLGKGETGSSVALPIWIDFMGEALADKPALPFRQPGGLRFVDVDAKTGLRADRSSEQVIAEAFLPGTEPERGAPPVTREPVVTPFADDAEPSLPTVSAAPPPPPSTGGLY